MAINPAHWTIDRQTGNIRYSGDDHVRFGGSTPSYATVIELHRWLMDNADNAVSSGDDELDITDPTPSDRSTDNLITLINGFNIDDTAAEHLYDGSIVQAAGAEIYDAIVNFGNAQDIQIHQNGAVLADDWWNTGSGGLNADATAGISHRFMIKVRTGGADVDGRRLIGTARRFNYTYAEFGINGTSRGNNVLALSESTDLNNQSTEANVATWTTVTNLSEGYSLIDVNNDSTPEGYYSQWDEGAGGETGRAGTINDIYERLKWLTRDGSVSTLYGINGELFRGITHELDISSGSGTWVEPESLSWSGGTGQVLAVDNNTGTATSKIWIQVLTGLAPSSGTVTGNGGATGTVSGLTDRRPVPTPVPGVSTGSALIGAYGFGVDTSDLGTNDLMRALDNSTYQPPNNVSFSVAGLVSGEDYVIVTNNNGSNIDFAQLTLNTSLTTDNITSVVVTAAIPSDTPATGYIRVQDNNGFYRRLHYSGWTGSTFTIDSVDGQEDFASVNATAPKNVFIAYLDKLATGTSESFTVVFNSTRSMFVRVRDGGTAGDVEGIKTFETTADLTSGGGGTTAIRTSDA